MINKLKQIKFTKKGVYISLAICTLIIGCIGVFSSIKNMNKIIEEADFEYDDVAVPTPVDVSLFEKETDEVISSPVINEEVPTVLEFMKPVEGEISKMFSDDELVYSETMNDYRTHNGIDILSEFSNPVYSAESGVISDIQQHPLWGNCITVSHENNYVTCYKNLSDVLPEGIEVGSYVSKGGIIGSIGASSLVEIGDQSHLHFEMYVNGEPVDPTEFLN